MVIKKDSLTLEAHLTNWGENGFFAQLNDSGQSLRGNIEVEITIETQTFFATGEVITVNDGGIGVRITKNPVPDLGWNDYYGIINELGLRPSYS